MVCFLCEDSFDGILSGIFDVYASKAGIENCRLEMREEYVPEMFTEYRDVKTEAWKAERVARKIRSFMSESAYLHLYRAALHNNPKRADWILRFVSLGLQHGRSVMRMLQEPAVYEVFQMDRYVGHEAHFHLEVARFERLENGIYFCKVGPVNRVLELMAEHFSDRFPDMNWVIYDEKHHSAAFHTDRGEWVIYHGITEEQVSQFSGKQETDCYVGLWKTFFHTIAIEERKNEKCQKIMLPLRYRKYMTEFLD